MTGIWCLRIWINRIHPQSFEWFNYFSGSDGPWVLQNFQKLNCVLFMDFDAIC